ncbi:unnamed protein product [Durusdinium trenchii]|uniref:Uncharacterized protein n=1 Tax=Durusdinium trenchii TaxID=1381693 RepID=A0ABP0KQF7_9DINO
MPRVRWWRIWWLWLPRGGSVETPPLPEHVNLTDWREVVWDASFCWDQDWTFFQCCRNGRDLDVLPGILQGLAKVRGHPDCWQPPEEGPVYHDNCCVLNANLDKVPRAGGSSPRRWCRRWACRATVKAWYGKRVNRPWRWPSRSLDGEAPDGYGFWRWLVQWVRLPWWPWPKASTCGAATSAMRVRGSAGLVHEPHPSRRHSSSASARRAWTCWMRGLGPTGSFST